MVRVSYKDDPVGYEQRLQQQEFRISQVIAWISRYWGFNYLLTGVSDC